MTRRKLSYALDWLLIFLFVAVLVRPMFRVKYMELWGSIESTFIADARFLSDHWVHPDWQPNWYGGTRTDYIYPPALRYGTAVLTKFIPNVPPVKAYRLYTAFFYCFGIAAVYLLARYGTGSRVAGGLAAFATALSSPSYLFVHSIRDETPWLLPYRLNVLVRYGEGPHMTAVAWLPLALLFSFRALQQWRPVSLALAGICCAMVVSNNFYGATALAMTFPVLAWAVFITHLDWRIWVRAVAIAVIAYGLTAFWLVPAYLQVTLYNMRFVSTQGNAWSVVAIATVASAIVLLSARFSRGRKDHAYVVFVSGTLAVFVTAVLGHHYLNFRIIGEPSRLYPELDMIMLLFAAEVLRRMWPGPVWRKAVAAAIVIAGFSTTLTYMRNARVFFMVDPNPTDNVEYRMQDWMARNMPLARSMTTGSVRFWYNAWHDLAQVGGGSEQGLLNPVVMNAQWEIRLGQDLDVALWWLQVLGADAILVNEPQSKEIYHDFQFPQKFRGKLEAAYDDGAGNLIYKIPRRFQSLARVVDRARFEKLPEIPGNGTRESLSAWADVLERGPNVATSSEWRGTDDLYIHAPVQGDQAVVAQVSYDPNWRAYANGKPVPIRPNKLGFMTIDAPAGTADIWLHFPTPLANQVGRVITVLTMICIGGLFYVGRRSFMEQ